MNQPTPTHPFVGSAASSAILRGTLLASVLAFTACGGDNDGVADTTQTPVSAVALQVSPPGALLGYVQSKLSEQVDAQVDNGLVFSGNGNISLVGNDMALLSAMTAGTEVGAKSFSSTTLQEGGVEEADLMKTDGTRVFSLATATPDGWHLNTLRVDRRLSDGSLQADGSLALEGTDNIKGLHVTARGERVVLLGQSAQWHTTVAGKARLDTTFAPTPMTPPQAVLRLVDAKTGQKLNQTHSIHIDGYMVDNRMIGDTLYVVTSWYPHLDVMHLSGATSEERKSAISLLTNRDLLPTVTVTHLGTTAISLTEPLMADTDCYLQTQNASAGVQMTTITAFNLASPKLERSSRCFLGGTEAFYLSPTNLYLATRRYESVDTGGILAYPGQVNTDIHKFAINGMNINYRGSGEVTGHLGWDSNKTSYRLSEHKGDLRVITYTNQFGWFGEPGTANATSEASPAILTVLREDGTGTKLQTISTLPNSKRPAPIGLSGEQVYAVRFLGERGYVVTFRRTDPLYILDLTDPTDPKVTGELKINGYSDYLLPVGEGLLLGVGKDANAEGRVQGVKVSLFDVSNASAPQEIATRVIGKAGSASALDYSRHGINLMSVAGITRIALPVTVNETADPFFGGWFRPSYQGLARFEVNAANKTLTDRPVLIGQTFPDSGAGYLAVSGWLGHERSVQIDSHVYYLTGQGNLISGTW